MAFNHPLSHDMRLRTGAPVGEAYDDSWIVMLVTHPYIVTPGLLPGDHSFPCIPWSAINPCSYFPAGDGALRIDTSAAGRNQYNATFQWNEYMAQHKGEAKNGLTPFALGECKQVKGLLRKLLPPKMTLACSQAALKQLRDAGQLQTSLAQRHATMDGVRNDNRKLPHELCGNDLRKCLLAEMLLLGTPLHGALVGDASLIALPEVPDAAGFFADVRSFLDDYRERERPPVSLVIQTAYESWLTGVHAALAALTAAAAPAAGEGL
jgi:hypothetical protein